MLKLTELEYEILRAKEEKKKNYLYDCESLYVLEERERERERTEKRASNQGEAK